MRGLLLFLSRQHRLRNWMETSPAAKRMSSRFVAGESLEAALAVSRRCQAEGLSTTLDHLGESVTSLPEARAAGEVARRTLHALLEAGLHGNLSLKLTQFGMDLDERVCRENVEALVQVAAGRGGFVRVDMESSAYTQRTLDLVSGLHDQYPGAVGAVIQAYLYRSQADVEMLCSRGIRVRLCKGAYLEPASVAFPAKAAVDENFRALLRMLLREGTYPAIATHDERLIGEAKDYARQIGRAHDTFEFQMLYGIRRDLQRSLVAAGYRVRLYVPFGKAWYPYFMRRLAERPANVLFLARNYFRH